MCGIWHLQELSYQVEVFADGSLSSDITLREDMLLLLSKEVDPTVCPTLMEGVNYLKDLRSGTAKVSVQDGFRQGGWSALLSPVFDTFNACTYVRMYNLQCMYKYNYMLMGDMHSAKWMFFNIEWYCTFLHTNTFRMSQQSCSSHLTQLP